MSAEDKKKDGGGWTTIPIREKPPVVNEDHPVVKKILEYIEKEIEPIEDEMERHIRHNDYLSYLKLEELVIYGIYKQLTSIPSIYKYYKTKQLSNEEIINLIDILGRYY